MTVDSIDLTSRRALVFTPLETDHRLLVEAAVHAEDCGYEAIVIPEGWGLDASVTLAAIAAHTSRLRLVAGVLSIWGRSPATLAMTAASLADVSNGRFVLGLGASTPQLATGLHGVPFRRPAERLTATIDTVRALLHGERTIAPDGARGMRLGRAPRPDVPIWVAGLGRRATAAAVSAGDAWYPIMIPLRDLPAHRLAATAGHPSLSELVTGPLIGVEDGDHPGARAAVEQTLAWYLTGMGPHYGNFVARLGYADAVDAVRAANPRPVPGRMIWPDDAEPLLAELAVVGDAAAVAERLRGWDRHADVVAVATGPTTAENVHRIIDVGAPPPAATRR